jgi:HEAT repeat protein
MRIDPKGRMWAEHALADKNVDVRSAAAAALGQIASPASIPSLQAALKDHEPAVVLAAAQSLYSMGDPSAFGVFESIVRGQQIATDNFIKSQLKTLKDRKTVMWMGIEEGAGFVPYAGFAVWLVETLSKDPAGLARAEAVRKLAKDTSRESAEALLEGTCDKTWQVRAASASATAARNDPALLPAVVRLLNDQNDVVRFSAAAAVLELDDSQRPAQLGREAASSGTRTRKVEPSPSLLSTSNDPPMSRTSFEESTKPIPLPPCVRDVEVCATPSR